MSNPAWSTAHGARSRGAFSLAEVLLALAIASFAILMLVAVVPSGLANLQDAQRRAAEARIVQQLAARYQMLPWDEATKAGATNGAETTYDGNGNPLAEGNTEDAVYRAQVEVLEGLPLPNEFSASPFLRRLRIRVTSQVNGSFTDEGRYRDRHVSIVNLDQTSTGGLDTPVEPPTTGTTPNP